MEPGDYQPRILVVDDEEDELAHVCEVVSALGYVPVPAHNGEEALDKLSSGPIDAIVTDLMMPRMDGFQFLTSLLERGDLTPAIVLTAFGSIDRAISIVHDLRAFWYLEKPVRQMVLGTLLERALQQRQLMRDTDGLRRQLSYEGFLGDLYGRSAPMQQIFALIRQVAPSTASVLITGESGTGKELVAAAIHKLSPRSSRPFVAINCAALPESLMESELFGSEKGAFTGAGNRRAGCFEQANQGTLLLDEIGEMPQPMQAKLLRVLQESSIRRLGGEREIPVDVRVLAATNRLIHHTGERAMREDLYYRLNVFQIQLPPLRERKDDIAGLVQVMIRQLNDRHGYRVTEVDARTHGALMEHSWPGNIRELRNVIERAAILAQSGPLLPEHLPRTFQTSPPVTNHVPPADVTKLAFEPGKPLHELEKAYVRITFEAMKRDRAKTAEALGISVRTLHTRLTEIAEDEAKAASANSGSLAAHGH